MSDLDQQLEAMETRINGLRDLLKRREGAAASCKNNVDPYAHSQNMDSQYGVIPAIRKELRDVATDFLRLKIDSGRWDPAELIERMALQRVPLVQPTVVEKIVRVPVQAIEKVVERTVESDATRERLAKLLDSDPGKFIPRSKLLEVIT